MGCLKVIIILNKLEDKNNYSYACLALLLTWDASIAHLQSFFNETFQSSFCGGASSSFKFLNLKAQYSILLRE
jgi:hypothetical protein